MGAFRQDVLIRQLQRLLGGNRVLSGTVSAGGAPVSGEGWSVNQTGTGVYVITYDESFEASPRVLHSPGSTSALYLTRISGRNAASVTINVYNTASPNASRDGEFDFAAIGR